MALKKHIFHIILALGLSHTFAQTTQDTLTKIKSVTLPGNVKNVSVDRYGFIYFTDQNENLYKYDSLGNHIVTFSPQKKAEITLVEAWRNVNIFLFYRNFQEFTLVDRFLNAAPNVKIDPSAIGFARMATLSYDNNLWIFDDTDFTLKKYNLRFNKLESTTSLDLLLDPSVYDIVFMREYQNQLYVYDRNSGVLVFDLLGNYKNKIPLKGPSDIGFSNDEIYYLENGKINFTNIYQWTTRSVSIDRMDYSKCLLSGQKVYLFENSNLGVYSLQPIR